MVALRKERSDASISLHLLLQPVDELCERSSAMRDLVLLHLWHLGVRLAVVLEACVPACGIQSVLSNYAQVIRQLTEISRSSSLHDLALRDGQHAFVSDRSQKRKSDLRASLKDDRLVPRTFTVRERADSLGRFVFEASQQFVELFHTKSLQEPLAAAVVSYVGQRCRY